ncbi:glycoside hydrolase family 2 TIM barrel-domain containing protein [Acidipropionibacterium timonense]|uniref:glycoside hydrolase family 2 TIM barrel-domain containing protein n=1 Tax=Acidipropionibacterium timonense TaxID=2161818 RepID=UPI0010321032|nr:glycoside hydrolase family 2 TIM barrel-domain containing protein [Acidipropionibacterium timonense]
MPDVALTDPDLTNLQPWSGPVPPRAHLTSDAPVLDLSGVWQFRWVRGLHEATEGFQEPHFDPSGFDEIEVPSCWQMVDPGGEAPYGQPAYLNVTFPIALPRPDEPVSVPTENPTGEYRRTFDLPEGFLDDGVERVLLRFEGVDSFARVWVNGVELGWTKGSRLTSEFDATSALHPGTNLLAVRVSQWSDATFLEDQDMWWVSGIFRRVSLLARPVGGIDDLFVHADYDEKTGAGTLRVDLTSSPSADIHLTDSSPIGTSPTGTDAADVPATGTAADHRPQCGTIRIPELGIEAPTDEICHIASVEPWTAESPRLYDATVSTPAETVSLRIGFRTVRVEDGVISVNGDKIVLRGVNRHEWHPRTGRTLDEATMRADLDLMKSHNINAVRTSHYPPDARFLDLCDEYGVWVLLENDLETHGFEVEGWAGNPLGDPRWYDCLDNRIRRTVERDKNHPCIIGWSMGNESFTGGGVRRMNDWVKDRDPDRFTHYEGDKEHAIADVWSEMYPAVERVRAIRDRDPLPDSLVHVGEPGPFPQVGRERGIPFLMCEFGHAMGNGPGELSDYLAVGFDPDRTGDRMHGGFIWEWIDQGIEVDRDGQRYFAYGGDFGEPLHDGNFICDGLLLPDRTPSPGLVEYAAQIAPARLGGRVEGDGVLVEVTNRRDITCLGDLRFRWELGGTGSDLEVPRLEPGDTASVRIPLTDLADGLEDAMWLHLVAEAAIDRPGVPAGHIAARGEVDLSPLRGTATEVQAVATTHPPRRVRSGFEVGAARFDRCGQLTALGDITIGSPVIDLYRAPIDNDSSPLAAFGILDPQHRAGLHRMVTQPVEVELVDDTLVVRTRTWAAAASRRMDATWRWTDRDGGAHLDLHVEPVGRWDLMLPRIGVTMSLPTDLRSVRWLGLGPGESYRDSSAGVWHDWFDADVSELQTPYVRPQENGARMDLSVLELRGEQGLRIDAERTADGSLPGFAYRPWTSAAMAAARHTVDLVPDDVLWLTLDLAGGPVGVSSCGPQPMLEHRLYAHPVDLSLTFTPLS